MINYKRVPRVIDLSLGNQASLKRLCITLARNVHNQSFYSIILVDALRDSIPLQIFDIQAYMDGIYAYYSGFLS